MDEEDHNEKPPPSNDSPDEVVAQPVQRSMPADADRDADAGNDSSDKEPTEAEPTQVALNADAQSAILDGVVALAALISHAQASMAQLIDQAREWNEVTAHSIVIPGEIRSEFEVQQLAFRSFVFEMACALRIPESTARALISDSEMLIHELQGTFHALADGEISYRHAQLMIDQALTLGPESRSEFEDAALDAAKTLTPSKFNTKARKLRERSHPESILVRRTAAFERRRIEFQPDLDGMAWVNLYQPAETAMAFCNAVRQQAMRLQRKDEPRTLTQLSLDVAVDAMLQGVQADPSLGAVPPMECGCPGDKLEGSGTPPICEPTPKSKKPGRLRGIRPTVIVTVPVLTLMGKGDEPAQLDGYGPIDPETARELAGEATSFIRLLVHPETGVPLSLSRDRYAVPKDLQLALSIRDGTCRGYGCNRSTATCDIDHTVAWQFHGPTHFDNLAYQCRHHHRLKHQTTWEARQMGDGFIEWTSPLKRKYVTAPEAFFPTTPTTPPTPTPPTPTPPTPTPPAPTPPTPSTPPPSADDVPPF